MVLRRALRGGGPPPPSPVARRHCPLCERPVTPGPGADWHHLLPRSQGGPTSADNLALLHRVCHRKIHASFGEKELARDYRSWAALRAHPEIAAFVRWVAARPEDFDDRSRKPRRRR